MRPSSASPSNKIHFSVAPFGGEVVSRRKSGGAQPSASSSSSHRRAAAAARPANTETTPPPPCALGQRKRSSSNNKVSSPPEHQQQEDNVVIPPPDVSPIRSMGDQHDHHRNNNNNNNNNNSNSRDDFVLHHHQGGGGGASPPSSSHPPHNSHHHQHQHLTGVAQECFTYLKHLVDNATTKALLLSVDHTDYVEAKHETAAASVAALESTESVLRLLSSSMVGMSASSSSSSQHQKTQQRRRQSAHAPSTAYSSPTQQQQLEEVGADDHNGDEVSSSSWADVFLVVSDLIKLSLNSLRGFAFSQMPPEPLPMHSFEQIEIHTVERIKLFHRMLFSKFVTSRSAAMAAAASSPSSSSQQSPAALSSASSSNKVNEAFPGSSSSALRRDGIALFPQRDPALLTTTALGLNLEPIDVSKVAGNSSSSRHAAAAAAAAAAADVVKHENLSLRIQNCDRMLARMKVTSARKAVANASSSSSSSSARRIMLLRKEQQEQEQEGQEEEEANEETEEQQPRRATSPPSSSSFTPCARLQMAPVVATTTPTSSVWADAEDALAVLRIRFIFQLWRIVARCDRQRRKNSAVFVRKLNNARAQVWYLRFMLSAKRSIATTRSAACRSYIKENKRLVDICEASRRREEAARDNRELATAQYRIVVAQLEKMRLVAETVRRSPMVFDLRRALRDCVSGKPIDHGVIEFRKVTTRSAAHHHRKTTTPKKSSGGDEDEDEDEDEQQREQEDRDDHDDNNEASTSSSSSSLAQVYPPFVDWAAPQNEHARDRIQASHVERCEQRGIAIPGYRAEQSYYEVRFTKGFVSDAFSSPNSSNSSNNNNKITNVAGAASALRVVSSVAARNAPAPPANAEDVRHITDEFYGLSFTVRRWDVEFCSMVNALLRHLETPTALSDKTKFDDGDDGDVSWNINLPFSEQICQRELMAGMLKSNAGFAAAVAQMKQRRRVANASSRNSNEDDDDDGSPSASGGGSGKKKKRPVSNAAAKKRRRSSAKRGGAFVAFTEEGASNNNNNDDEHEEGGNLFSKFHTPATDAVISSVKRARDAFTSISQQLHEACDSFVSETTDRFIELANTDEARLTKKRALANTVKADTQAVAQREEGNDDDDDQHKQLHKNDIQRSEEKAEVEAESGVSVNHRCAIAPPAVAPHILLRNNALFIESPADVVRHPEIAVRLFVVLFGQQAIMDELKNSPNHSASYAEIASTLLKQMMFTVVSGVTAATVAAATTAPTDHENNITNRNNMMAAAASKFFDHHHQHATTSTSSGGGNISNSSHHQTQLRNGRELCSLIQAHLSTSMAVAEADAAAVRATSSGSSGGGGSGGSMGGGATAAASAAGDAFMLRRMASGMLRRRSSAGTGGALLAGGEKEASSK